MVHRILSLLAQTSVVVAALAEMKCKCLLAFERPRHEQACRVRKCKTAPESDVPLLFCRRGEVPPWERDRGGGRPGFGGFDGGRGGDFAESRGGREEHCQEDRGGRDKDRGNRRERRSRWGGEDGPQEEDRSAAEDGPRDVERPSESSDLPPSDDAEKPVQADAEVPGQPVEEHHQEEDQTMTEQVGAEDHHQAEEPEEAVEQSQHENQFPPEEDTGDIIQPQEETANVEQIHEVRVSENIEPPQPDAPIQEEEEPPLYQEEPQDLGLMQQQPPNQTYQEEEQQQPIHDESPLQEEVHEDHHHLAAATNEDDAPAQVEAEPETDQVPQEVVGAGDDGEEQLQGED